MTNSSIAYCMYDLSVGCPILLRQAESESNVSTI